LLAAGGGGGGGLRITESHAREVHDGFAIGIGDGGVGGEREEGLAWCDESLAGYLDGAEERGFDAGGNGGGAFAEGGELNLQIEFDFAIGGGLAHEVDDEADVGILDGVDHYARRGCL